MTTHVLHATGLGDVSKALQALHQHLLTFQADQAFFLGSPLELYERATKDPVFAWLRPLLAAIVDLDERRAGDTPITAEEVAGIRERIRDVIEAPSGPIRLQLNAAYQSHPEVVWSMADLRRALAALD